MLLLYGANGLRFIRTVQKTIISMSRQDNAEHYLPTELLPQIIESAPILISFKDLQGRVLFANRRFDVLDLPERSLWMGKTVFELFPKEIAEQLWANDVQAQKQREPLVINEQVHHKDGSMHIYQTIKFGLYDEQGAIYGTGAISRDISDLHRALEFEQEYKNILAVLSEGVIKVNRRGEIRVCNQAASSLLRLDLSNKAGECADAEKLQLFDENGAPLLADRHPCLQLFQTGVSIKDQVVRLSTTQADARWLLVNSSPLTVDADGAVQEVVTSFVCIDAQKKTQQEMMLYQEVFERSSDAIIVYNEQRKIIKINQAFQKITGYCAEDVIGKGPEIFRTADHSEAFYQEIEIALTEKGLWQGEVNRRRKDGTLYTAWLTTNRVVSEAGELTHYISIFSDIDAIKRHEKELSYLAHHDALTGLPNRNLLMDRVMHALPLSKRKDRKHALLFIDLDRFKEVNDTAGHSVGDAILIETARRMRECIRESDTLARLGGDEFMLLMEDISSKDEVALIAERMRQVMQQPFHHAGKEFYLSCSMGISLIPEDGDKVDDLISRADSAMYQAKAKGRNTWAWFDRERYQRESDDVDIERALHKALANQELFLVFQPQMDLITHKVVGAEVLLRWQHPERGVIPPLTFIPIAERSGLIIPIGEWVIAESCRQLAEWDSKGLHVPVIAINVSAKQIPAPDFAKRVLAHLTRHQLRSDRMELELTESVLMNIDNVQNTVEIIRSHGIHLAIDDFGTGFSSLTYLRELPIQRLKIDRSFLQQVPGHRGDESIIRAVIGLAHNLDIDVIAEGVETGAQRDFLLQNHCYSVQGYYFAKPMKAPEFETFMRNTLAANEKISGDRL